MTSSRFCQLVCYYKALEKEKTKMEDVPSTWFRVCLLIRSSLKTPLYSVVLEAPVFLSPKQVGVKFSDFWSVSKAFNLPNCWKDFFSLKLHSGKLTNRHRKIPAFSMVSYQEGIRMGKFPMVFFGHLVALPFTDRNSSRNGAWDKQAMGGVRDGYGNWWWMAVTYDDFWLERTEMKLDFFFVFFFGGGWCFLRIVP